MMQRDSNGFWKETGGYVKHTEGFKKDPVSQIKQRPAPPAPINVKPTASVSTPAVSDKSK